MQFQIQGKPVVVTSEDAEKNIHHGWVAEDPTRPGQLLLCATNSYAFVRVPIGAPPEGFEHSKGPVPHEALVFQATHPDMPVKLAERHVMVGSDVSFRRDGDTTFPDVSKMIPEEPAKPMRVALDSTLLSGLAEAMGTERVEIVFDLDKLTDVDGVGLYNKPIFVRRASADGKGEQVVPDGILMPVRVDPGARPTASAPEEAAPPPAEPQPAAPPEPAAQEPPPPPAEPESTPPPEHPPPPTA